MKVVWVKRWFLGVSAVVLVSFGITGCAVFSSDSTKTTKTERTLWHSREQNVRIVSQDKAKGASPAPNDHPIVLVPDQIRAALRTLEVRQEDSDKFVPVFTEPELDVLGSKLAEALSVAGPDEDVTFTVVGQRKAVFGLAKTRKATTGRVFYREGKLNVIFGKMIDDIKEQYDFRLSPFTPGSRAHAVNHKWLLGEVPDVEFHNEGDVIRSDWVVIDLASIAAQEALGVKASKQRRMAVEEPARTPTRAAGPEERQSLPAAAQPSQAGKTKSVEERLTILNDLKNKKLITDEEYKAKRSMILNDL